MEDKYKWENDAYKCWKNNDFVGIVEAHPGAGKTHLGIRAVKKFPNAVISVPNILLMYQWKEKMLKYGISPKDIGLCGDGNKSDGEPIIVGVINTLRKMKFKKSRTLLILDEVQHSFSEENKRLIERNNFKSILGLSATPDERALDNIPIVFELTKEEGLKNGSMCPFKLIKKVVELSEGDKMLYDRCTFNMHQFFRMYPEAKRETNGNIWKWKPSNQAGWDAKKLYRKSVYTRISIMTMAESKIRKTIKLIKRNLGKKMIVFCNLQKLANRLSIELAELEIDNVVYHSSSGTELNYALKSDIIIAVKSLDEGLDKKDAEVGIIVAWDKKEQQAIQRIGRILRSHGDKKAKIYVLVAKDTKDDTEFEDVYSEYLT